MKESELRIGIGRVVFNPDRCFVCGRVVKPGHEYRRGDDGRCFCSERCYLAALSEKEVG